MGRKKEGLEKKGGQRGREQRSRNEDKMGAYIERTKDIINEMQHLDNTYVLVSASHVLYLNRRRHE